MDRSSGGRSGKNSSRFGLFRWNHLTFYHTTFGDLFHKLDNKKGNLFSTAQHTNQRSMKIWGMNVCRRCSICLLLDFSGQKRQKASHPNDVNVNKLFMVFAPYLLRDVSSRTFSHSRATQTNFFPGWALFPCPFRPRGKKSSAALICGEKSERENKNVVLLLQIVLWGAFRWKLLFSRIFIIRQREYFIYENICCYLYENTQSRSLEGWWGGGGERERHWHHSPSREWKKRVHKPLPKT